MAKMSSSGTHLWIGGATTPTASPVQTISKAAPAVVTMPSALPADFKNGDMVVMSGTGEARLDGKAFAADSVGSPASSFALRGTDLMDLAADLTAGSAQLFTTTGANASLVGACPATIGINQQDPESIDLDDLCDSETVLGEAKPPTFTLDGWVNKDNAGFVALVCMSLENPRKDHQMLITFPDGSYIMGLVQMGALGISAGKGQGVGFSGGGTFRQMPTYSWCLQGHTT